MQRKAAFTPDLENRIEVLEMEDTGRLREDRAIERFAAQYKMLLDSQNEAYEHGDDAADRGKEDATARWYAVADQFDKQREGMIRALSSFGYMLDMHSGGNFEIYRFGKTIYDSRK